VKEQSEDEEHDRGGRGERSGQPPPQRDRAHGPVVGRPPSARSL
jgi:hypothetical protein